MRGAHSSYDHYDAPEAITFFLTFQTLAVIVRELLTSVSVASPLTVVVTHVSLPIQLLSADRTFPAFPAS